MLKLILAISFYIYLKLEGWCPCYAGAQQFRIFFSIVVVIVNTVLCIEIKMDNYIQKRFLYNMVITWNFFFYNICEKDTKNGALPEPQLLHLFQLAFSLLQGCPIIDLWSETFKDREGIANYMLQLAWYQELTALWRWETKQTKFTGFYLLVCVKILIYDGDRQEIPAPEPIAPIRSPNTVGMPHTLQRLQLSIS